MKHKMLLLILAAMLFSISGAMATPIIGDNDTLWTKQMSGVTNVKFHPSGNTVFVCQEPNEFFEIDANTGEKVYQYRHPNPEIVLSRPRHFDVNKAGTKVASIHYDTVFIWDYLTKVINKRLYFNTTAVFFGNNDKYLFGFLNSIKPDEGDNLWIYDMETDEIKFHGIKIINILDEGLSALATSPDGKYFALASQYEDIFTHETKCNLAVFDATTFEKVVDVVFDEVGSIDEIEFSRNSKWIAYKNPGGYSKIIDLQKLMDTGVKDKVIEFNSRYLRIDTSERFVFQSALNSDTTQLIDISNNEIVLTLNFRTLSAQTQNSNNNLLLRVSKKLIMLNSNWFKLDVVDPIVESVIPILNYTETTLNYSLSLQNPVSIKVTDSVGTTIYSSFTNIQTNSTIELPLSSGVYLFTVNDGQRDYTKKFIVVR